MTHQVYGSALVVLSAGLCWAFVITYQAMSGGAWRDSEAGRHLMVSMATFAVVLSLTAVRALLGSGFDTAWFVDVRAGVFTLVPAVFGWRLWLLVRAQHSDRQQRKGRDDLPGQ